MLSERKIKRAKTLIRIASILIPVVVALLFGIKLQDFGIAVEPLRFLPPIYATINGITAILLIVALIAIKQKKIQMHQNIIKTCMILSLLFLCCYVAYHMTSDSTIYGDINGDGVRDIHEKIAVEKSLFIYGVILLSHILLSVVIIPLVLLSYLFAWQGDYKRHKKWTRFAWPIWFYVASSGVVVYWMISPYYH